MVSADYVPIRIMVYVHYLTVRVEMSVAHIDISLTVEAVSRQFKYLSRGLNKCCVSVRAYAMK